MIKLLMNFIFLKAGPNVICSTATDNTYMNSPTYCFTLLAGVTPVSITGGGSPSGALSATIIAGNNGIITWTATLSMPSARPTKEAMISLYFSNGTLVFEIDASVFPTVTYSGTTLSFETGNSFAPGDYYWNFGYGVAIGTLYCLPQSDAITSTTFWTFSVSATATTTLAAATVPASIGASGASSTAAPILPVGVTTTTTTTTTTVAGNTVAMVAGAVTTTTTTTTTSTTSTTSTTTTTVTTTTLSTTTTTKSFTTATIFANSTNPCDFTTFIIVCSGVWVSGTIIHMIALISIFLVFLK
jgi:hypothetical protein